MPPACLTVLAPIKPDAVPALRQVLREIGDDVTAKRLPPGGRPHVDFSRSRTIHFARFAILADPDRGPDRARLLYAAVYDGSLEAHAGELLMLSTDFDAIWSTLEGYTGRDGFVEFLHGHSHEPAAYYVAFPRETLLSIRSALGAVDDGVAGGTADLVARQAPAPSAIVRLAAGIRWTLRAAPIVVDLPRAMVRYGFLDVYRGALRILACLDRYPLFRGINWLTRNRLPPRRSAFSSVGFETSAAPSPLAPGDEIPSDADPRFREDVVSQNQLTVVTVIADGGANRVRAVMSAIDSYAKRLAPPGSLIGISTIHFVRWLVIDNGRRLMMISDYDGSWESYIDEFAEMILSGLDAIWETAAGYPPDGARDLPAFKWFLRSHQVPAEIFFSAYPRDTVLTIGARIRTGRAAIPGPP